MGIPKFFKLPKNKQFNYQPIFYNPEKEAREKRKKEIERELEFQSDDQNGDFGRLRRGAIREYYYKKSKKVRRQSNYRLVVLIIILLFIAYLLLYR